MRVIAALTQAAQGVQAQDRRFTLKMIRWGRPPGSRRKELGGFVPPLVMGFVYGRLGSYGLGLALLAVTAALTLILTTTVTRSAVSHGATVR
ncbi:hypothetical protein AB0J35_36285 [Nonomuraea angiospora]|uniref:hypothetical protein n=1 Tax=Nonomuraea angiospora TaxID=46172 RepID=UPI00342F2675